MKFDLAKMLAEIERDQEKKAEAEPGKILTQAEIKALARSRRQARKSAK